MTIHEASEQPTLTRLHEQSQGVSPTQVSASRAKGLDQASVPPGYEVLGELGRGGMGVVYQARQQGLGRLVALKMVLGGSHASDAVLDRNRLEAAAIARLQHPNIVQVYEYGEHEGLPYFALEFVGGGSLANRVAGVPQPPREAARLVATLARALHHAHQANIIHRDLKPANILLTTDGVPKIADFGLAKRLDADQGLTNTGQIMGTAAYMPPEQAASQQVSFSADIYSLGAILFELLTGRPPFCGSNFADTLFQVLEQEPPSPRQLNSTVPVDLETICLKCLNKDPARRYASANDLAEDLERFLDDRPIAARPVGRPERLLRWARRNPGLAGLTATVMGLLLLTAVAGVVFSVQLRAALQDANEERDKGRQRLYDALVSDANALRLTQRAGQRFGSLARLKEALEIGADLSSDDEKGRLRSIALAALCQPDMTPGPRWRYQEEEVPASMGGQFTAWQKAQLALERKFTSLYLPHGIHWYSLDGRFVLLGRETYDSKMNLPVRVWRVDGEKPETVADVDQVHEEGYAFRPDSRAVAFGHGDGIVSVYDLPSGQRTHQFQVGGSPIFYLAYHPHLPRLAIAHGSELILWDLATGQQLHSLRHPSRVNNISWHPRGDRLVTACSGTEIRLWNAETGEQIGSIWRGHRTDGILTGFHPSGQWVASNDWSGVLRLWDVATGRQLLSVVSWAQPHFSADGQYVGLYAPEQGVLQTFRLAVGQEMRTFYRATAQGPQRTHQASLHPQERLLAVLTDSGLSLHDFTTGEELVIAEGGYLSRHMTFDQTGNLWTISRPGLMRWPVHKTSDRWHLGPPLWEADALNSGWDGMTISPDGQRALVPLYSRGALLVDRGPPRREVVLGPQYDTRSTVISPNGRWVVTRSHWDKKGQLKCQLWDANTGRLVYGFPYPAVDSVRFSSDSRWVYTFGQEERQYEIVRLTSGWQQAEPSRELQAWEKPPVSQAGTISLDNRLAAYGSDEGYLRLIRLDTGKELARLPSPEAGRLLPMSFTQDGSILMASGEETGYVYIYDLRLLRSGLAELGLDWDLPAYPPAATLPQADRRLVVTLHDPSAAINPVRADQAELERALLTLRSNPFDPEANYRLGVQLLNNSPPRLDAAYQHLSLALTLEPRLSAARRPRLIALIRLQRWAEVEAEADRILADSLGDVQTRLFRGHARRLQKKFKEAIVDYDEALRVSPESPTLYQARSICHAALGNQEQAKADRTAAERFAPNSPTAQNNEAWRLATAMPPARRDPIKALELIERAMRAEPENATFLNTLGVVQYRNGLYRQARETLTRSLHLGKDDNGAFDLYFLAMCHQQLDDSAKARERFDLAEAWVQKHKARLSTNEQRELEAFRVEAMELLKLPAMDKP